MHAMTKPATVRQAIDVCEIKLGSRVRVLPTAKYSSEWEGEYIVVSMTWRYQDAGPSVMNNIDIGIATEEDIERRYGYTDGFSLDDLELVR